MQQNIYSAKLLKLWAYFDNQNLWFKLLQKKKFSGLNWLCQITKDKFSFNDALRILYNLSLVEFNKPSKRNEIKLRKYKMHSCVHF